MAYRHFAIALFALAAPVAASEGLSLETQFGETVPILGDGQPRVIIYSDEAGAQQADAWGEALNDLACPAVGAARLSEVPGLARATVVESLREKEPLALDWQGRLAERLGFTPGVANVYLVDGRGQVLLRLHGAPESARIGRLRQAGASVCER